jgi:hypothetical protein
VGRRIRLVGVGLAPVLVAGAFWAVQQARTPGEKGGSNSADRTGKTTAVVAALERRMERLERRQLAVGQLARTVRGSARSVNSGDSPAPAAVPPPSSGDPARTRRDETDAQLATAFAGEAVDDRWALVARDSVERPFSEGVFPGARVSSVECRTSLCRAVVEVEDTGGGRSFAAEFHPSIEGFHRVRLRRVARDGEQSTWVAYMVREGREPPPSAWSSTQ